MFKAIEVLLETSDFKSMTIQQIAREAEVAPSLLYTRFKNKKEIEILFIEQFLHHYVGYLEQVDINQSGTSEMGKLESLIRIIIELSKKNKAVLRAVAIQQINGEDPLSTQSKALLEKRKNLLSNLLKGCFEDTQLDDVKLRFSVTLILFLIQTYVLFPGADSYLDLNTAVTELIGNLTHYLTTHHE